MVYKSLAPVSHRSSPSFSTQSYGGYGGGYGGGNGGSYSQQGGWGSEDKMHNLGGGLRAIDWSAHKLERFEKNFYVEDKRVSARSDREIEEFRRAKEMKVPRFLSSSTSASSRSFTRSKAALFPGLSPVLTRQASQSTSCPPSVLRVSLLPLPYSVKLGPWPSAVTTSSQLPRPEAERQSPLLFLQCFTSMRAPHLLLYLPSSPAHTSFLSQATPSFSR